MQKKLENLRQNIKKLKRILLAFSGGVDSTFLAKICIDVLGKDNVLAVTAKSGLVSPSELKEAVDIARNLKIPHKILDLDALDIPNFSDNPPQRCYYCKQELFSRFITLAKEEGLDFVIEGTNADDTEDFRPGRKAIRELGIKSPLRQSKLTKAEIRILSKELSLSTWDKPSFACLASRFPYGEKITREKLERVGQAEDYLRKMGFSQFRVRNHKDLARIEVLPSQIKKFMDKGLREKIVKTLKNLGFAYVTLDLIGYRMGSMNEVLHEEDMALWKE